MRNASRNRCIYSQSSTIFLRWVIFQLNRNCCCTRLYCCNLSSSVNACNRWIRGIPSHFASCTGGAENIPPRSFFTNLHGCLIVACKYNSCCGNRSRFNSNTARCALTSCLYSNCSGLICTRRICYGSNIDFFAGGRTEANYTGGGNTPCWCYTFSICTFQSSFQFLGCSCAGIKGQCC